MMNQLEIRDLVYFNKIATLGHMGKAAEALHRSQPALTSCIKRIESVLGAPVFEKSGRNIKLTPAGHLLLRRSLTMIHHAESLVKEVQEFSLGAADLVRVGLIPTAAQNLLAPITQLLMEECPRAEIKATIGQTDKLVNDLKNNELDLIISLATDLGDDYEACTFFYEKMVVIANSHHPIFNQDITIERLAEYYWVLGPHSVTSRQWIDKAFELQGLKKPKVKVETNLLTHTRSLLMATDLLSFVVEKGLIGENKEEKHIKRVPLEGFYMPTHYQLIHRKDSAFSYATSLVKDAIITQGKSWLD